MRTGPQARVGSSQPASRARVLMCVRSVLCESEQTLLQFFKTIVASSSSTDPQRGLPTSKPSLLRRRTSELHQTVPRKLLEPFQSLDANEYLSSIQDALETTDGDAQRRVTPRLVDPSFDDQGCGAEHAGFDLVIMGVQEMQ